MRVLGLTGGVGMGKTACAQLLAERHVPIADTDLLARQVVAPGQPALAEIQQSFGAQFLTSEGLLRREVLAEKVFADPPARRRLENILHPRIRRLWQAQIEAWRADGQPLAVVIIPLLFETGAERELDATVCVACSSATQHQRLLARGWSARQIEQRIEAQWPLEKKMLLADYVIWSEGTLEVHSAQLDLILSFVTRKEAGAAP